MPNAAQPDQHCSLAEPGLLPRGEHAAATEGSGAQDEPDTGQSRGYRRLKCCRPQKSRLALVKLKATNKNERDRQYPTGIRAGAYLFHHFTVSKDSHENLAQTDRWPELSIPSPHVYAIKRNPKAGPCHIRTAGQREVGQRCWLSSVVSSTDAYGHG